jgi:hypothetical protein
MCSLKTEQRKVQKRVRTSAPVASANVVDVQVNFRIILKDNKVQQFDARQGTATRPDPGSTLIEG